MDYGQPVNPDVSAANLRSAEFMRLFVKSEPRLYAYIRSLVVDQTDAEEVLQQTATVSWMKFDEFQPGTDFVRWAIRIAYWEVRSLVKRKRRDALVFSETFIEALAEDSVRAVNEFNATHEALHDVSGQIEATRPRPVSAAIRGWGQSQADRRAGRTAARYFAQRLPPHP